MWLKIISNFLGNYSKELSRIFIMDRKYYPAFRRKKVPPLCVIKDK